MLSSLFGSFSTLGFLSISCHRSRQNGGRLVFLEKKMTSVASRHLPGSDRCQEVEVVDAATRRTQKSDEARSTDDD